MYKDKKIGVLMGGLSAEREISLQSGQTALQALLARGYDAVPLQVDARQSPPDGDGQANSARRGLCCDVDRLLRQAEVDAVFNALHGRYGEDGCIQGLLELVGLPYTGSSVLASALSMNKVKAKELFRLHNLPTPPYYIIARDRLDQLETIHGSFGFPVVVKPAGEGSSIGVSLVEDPTQLLAACKKAFALDEQVLVERHIVGKEVHVGILDGRALGAIGIVSSNDLFDYEAKYKPGHAHFFLPARLSPERYRGVLTQAMRAHHALGCSGATRVDMIVSDLGNEYILEVNTAPGLTKRSLLPRIAKHAGLSYGELVERILRGAKLHGMGTVDVLQPGVERRLTQLPFNGPERRQMVVAN